MVISPRRIIELNSERDILENLDDREYNPEGILIDLRLASAYRIEGKGFLGRTQRVSPKTTKIADIEAGDERLIIKPGDYLLVTTMEKVNLPAEKIEIFPGEKPVHLMAQVFPRTTLHRYGIKFTGTKVDPGYYGALTFAMSNIGPCEVEIELGARIASLMFMEVKGDLARAYEGQWKGGRVAAKKLEKQI